MKSLFSVGEVVVLQCKTFPEYNGEYVVERLFSPNEVFECRLLGKQFGKNKGNVVGYVFNEPLLNKSRQDGREVFWSESALRKKHTPSSQSFSEMMSYLNNNIVEKM